MLTAAFKLRYQVYCVERQYLPAEDFPSGLERDEHDDHSAHFGVFDVAGDLVGYVRLVHARDGKYPFKHHCENLYNDAYLPPAADAVEISRLMVRQDYRRFDASSVRASKTSEMRDFLNARPTTSTQILLHLYRQMLAYSVEHGLGHWYAAMERSLARSLKSMGLGFKQVGPQTHYFGPVAPYLSDLGELLSTLLESNPVLHDWMHTRAPVAPGPFDWHCRMLRHPLQSSPPKVVPKMVHLPSPATARSFAMHAVA